MLKQSQVEKDLTFFLNSLGVKFQKGWLANQIDGYSKTSIIETLSTVFSELRIRNIAISPPLDMVANIPKFALILMKNGRLYTYLRFKNNKLHCQLDETTEYIVDLKTFSLEWTNIIFLVEKTSLSGQENYEKEELKLRYEYYGSTIFFLLFLFSTIYPVLNLDNRFLILYFILSVIGCVVSYIIITKENDWSHNYIDKICNIGGKFNCKDVLNSSVSGLLGFSLAELGLFYFSGSTIFIYLSSIVNTLELNVLSILSFYTIITISFSLFSLYYQVIKLKRYCPLCLFVLFIFLLEFIVIYPVFTLDFDFSFLGLSILILSFSIVPVFWNLLKDKYFGYQELIKKTKDLNFLESHNSIKKILLEQSNKIEQELPIRYTYGNQNLEKRLNLVLNPRCSSCQYIFNKLIRIQEFYSHIFFLNVIIKVDKEDIHYILFFDKLYSYYMDENKNGIKILNKIFGDPSEQHLKEIDRKYFINYLDRDVTLVVYNDIGELEKNGIFLTPTLLWNNKIIPPYFNSKFQKMLSILIQESTAN